MAARQPPAPQGAAAAAPGAHPQYSLPKYTPEELYVQTKQAEEIQKDVRHFVQMDTGAPFANLQDAVVRLLPFHLFNAADPATADLDDTPDHMGADLMASRHEAWEELCISKANDLRRRAEVHSSSIADLEARMDKQALSGTRSIDHYAMAKTQQDDLKQKIAGDKAALAKLLPPAAPAAAAPAGAVGRPGQTGAGAGVLGLAGPQGLQPGAAAAAAKAAGRVPQQQVLIPNALGMLQAQQLLRQQQALASLTPQQQLAAVQMQQLMLQQQGLQPAALAALQQHQQQQQQLLAQMHLLAQQQKKP